MARMLRNLEITKVDVVDKGANQKAHMKLFKRAGKRGATARRLIDALTALGKAEDFEGAGGDARANDDQLDAGFGAMTEEDEYLLEALVNRIGRAAVLRFIEEIAKCADGGGDAGEEAIDAKELAVAKRYALLGKDAGALTARLSRARGAGEAEYGALIDELEDALSEIVKRGIFNEIGKRDRGEGLPADPWVRIERAAADRMAAEPSLGRAAAIEAVCAAHPDWVREYERARMGL